jgi:hypothetical protein
LKPLLVGQAPARSGDGRAFTGASGKRLCSLLEIESYDDLAHLLDMTNLIPEIQPKIQGRKGDSFDRALARRAAMRIFTHAISEGRSTVILAGKGVGNIFLPDTNIEYFAPYDRSSLRCWVIPHPSGINHFWNDPTNVKKASRILRAIVFDWPMSHPSLRN